MAASTFLPREVALAVFLTAVLEAGFFITLIQAGKSTLHIRAKPLPTSREIPISVLPVLDDAPLLKQGTKKVKRALPDMWKKPPPSPRVEPKSAPSPQAKKTPETIPSAPVALRDAAAPAPDAEVAKQVDEPLLDAGPKPGPQPEGEGSPDGVKEGTETDPLKARAVDQYKARIIAWFNARFRPPAGEIDCRTLRTLNAAVTASVGPDRTVTSYSLARSSQNEIFDNRVKITMDQIIGQELPPPPPLYPDILESTVHVRLSGQSVPCEN